MQSIYSVQVQSTDLESVNNNNRVIREPFDDDDISSGFGTIEPGSPLQSFWLRCVH